MAASERPPVARSTSEGVESRCRGRRLHHQQRAGPAERAIGEKGGREVAGRVGDGTHGQTGMSREEPGKLVRAEPDDRYTERLEAFDRGAQVENGFRARADRDDARP